MSILCKKLRESLSANGTMRTFADACERDKIVQAPLAQLPWYHHLTLMERLKSRGDHMAYATLAVENDWLRNVIVHQTSVSTYQLGLPTLKQLKAKSQKVLVAQARTMKGGVK